MLFAMMACAFRDTAALGQLTWKCALVTPCSLASSVPRRTCSFDSVMPAGGRMENYDNRLIYPRLTDIKATVNAESTLLTILTFHLSGTKLFRKVP